MILLQCLCLFSLMVAGVWGQSCPSSAGDCVKQSGFRSFPPDPWLVCTTSVKQLLTAMDCIVRCDFEVPQGLASDIARANNTCSQMQGCGGYIAKFDDLRTCYGTEADLTGTIQQIITLFNSRLTNQAECLKLRGIRSCIKALTNTCAYLDYFYRVSLMNLESLDLALYLCGAENVESADINAHCSDQMYRHIENSCGVACALTNAATAGDFCNVLQTQASCIESYSQGCSEVRSRLLLPRLDTYSFVNQLFHCNITVFGILVKPSDYNGCNYRTVLHSCFGISKSVKITYKDVQKYVNEDIFTDDFRSKLSSRDDEVQECTRSQWSCLVPLSRAIEKPASPLDFMPSIGTFPLNSWGLNYAFDSFNNPPEYRPTMICKNPGYNAVRSTIIPLNLGDATK